MSNRSRREAYRYYRSLGYSAKEAANMRNRSPQRLVTEYRSSMRNYRKAMRDDFEMGKKPASRRRPYRPDLEVIVDRAAEIRASFGKIGLSETIIDQMVDQSEVDLIDLEVFNDRMQGFKTFFDGTSGPNFRQILDELWDIVDLGELLDILGEYYSERQGE